MSFTFLLDYRNEQGEISNRRLDCSNGRGDHLACRSLLDDVSAPMTLAPNRRRFRFSLWTLCVVMTFFGCWLGFQLNWIRQRHAFEARTGVQSYVAVKKGLFNAPGLLQFFGEAGRATIVLQFPADPTAAELQDVQLARRLFPEAETVVKVTP
jgi:hypothetical protein